jgi:hypothetical protein
MVVRGWIVAVVARSDPLLKLPRGANMNDPIVRLPTGDTGYRSYYCETKWILASLVVAGVADGSNGIH